MPPWLVAALMLVMLLFKLGVDSRASELGIVLAVGWRRAAARRMYLLEGAAVAAAGLSAAFNAPLAGVTPRPVGAACTFQGFARNASVHLVDDRAAHRVVVEVRVLQRVTDDGEAQGLRRRRQPRLCAQGGGQGPAPLVEARIGFRDFAGSEHSCLCRQNRVLGHA